MPYPPKIALFAPSWDSPKLRVFVEDILRDGVSWVCVYGPDCGRVHDVIDELVVGDGSDETRWQTLMTTWHTDQTLEDVLAFLEDVPPHGAEVATVCLDVVAEAGHGLKWHKKAT